MQPERRKARAGAARAELGASLAQGRSPKPNQEYLASCHGYHRRPAAIA
jgi:hypothetical protein